MISPFSLRLYVHDVVRADAFDKCTIPKTNGPDNRQSTIDNLFSAMVHSIIILVASIATLSLGASLPVVYSLTHRKMIPRET